MNNSADISILHVDDEPDFVELAAEMLERDDNRFTVETATSASEGLDRLAETTNEFDCIVSDYDMPGQNGIEFLESVREDYPNLPFILFTGKGSEEVASEAISIGITDYLQKESGTEQYTILANRIRNAVEKRQSERARQRHLEAIETAHEGISILNEDGQFLYVNEAYAELYGYDPDEMIGEHWKLIYPEDEVETARETILPEVEETGFWHGTTTGLRADGSTFREDHRIATTDHGELVCTVRDMTERKERQQELEQTNTVLRTIVEHLPMGVLVEDTERDVLMANDQLGDTLGVPLDSDDLIGRDCDAAAEELQDLFADPEGFIDGIRTRIEQREPVHNEELTLADDRVLERDYVPYSLPDGEANLWLYRDITDRKEREQELKRREAYLEHSHDIVTVVDADGTVQFQSESTEQMTGFSPSEVTGESGFEHVHPDDRDEITSLFTSVIDQPDEVASTELRVETREGSWRWIEARGVNKLADPVIDGIVINSRDITERKEYEQELNTRAKAMDTAIDGMALLDDDGEYVYVNEAHADIYGYDDPEAFLGETWRMCYDDEVIDRFEEDIIPALSGKGSWRGEVTGRRKDGSTFPQELSLTATDDGGIICVVRDITERKEQIQQVERERDRFAAIFEAVPEPIVHVRFDDEQPIVKNINSAFTDTFGYDPTDIEGESINDAIVPDEHIDEARQIDASVQDRGTVEREVERVAADGRRPFLFRSNRFEVADDTMESIGVYIDLTEQKQRAQQLEFERDRLESLFTAIPEPAVEVEFTDDGPLLRDVNEAFETTFGYDAAAVRGEDINDLIVPDDPEVRAEAEAIDVPDDPEVRAEAEAIDERARAGEQLTREVQRETSDGLRDFLFRSAPIDHKQDGETPQQFGLYIDITERKERERALEHLQQRTQELMHTATNEETAQVAVEAAHDVADVPLSGCHLVDDEQRRLEPTAVVDTGREELGDPPAYERTADDAPAAEVVWQAFEDGEPLVIDDTREYGRLAEVTPARSAIIYPLDDYGVFIVSATEPNAFDDTDTTLTEIIATSLKTALKRVDREQTLERQNDRLDQFTSIVSHDLRNPLSVAQGHLDLAREACDSEHLDDVAQAHDRMEKLIDDLLTLARHGERVEERETVELADLTDACWHTVATADATLVTETAQTIQADPSRLKQLLENLFRNAVEHAGENITVTVGDLDAGFYVADDGPGIPDEERDHVFEAGYSTADDGTGVGLNIVQEIAEAHGWEISVTDSENGGARFEITGVEAAAA